jgi:hypothetical protein
MMSLNQARIVTAILAGLVLFAEVSIPDRNAKANLARKPAPTSIPAPVTITTTTLPKTSEKNNTPQLHAALHHLKEAKIELENASDLDRSNQAEALKEASKAISEIEAALKSAPKRSIAKSSKPDDCNT